MEKELRNEMENFMTNLAYKIFRVITAKDDNNKLLEKVDKSIERFKNRMSQEEYEKFKYFVLGHKYIDILRDLRLRSSPVLCMILLSRIRRKGRKKKKFLLIVCSVILKNNLMI
mgnify:CR=1 FL=1